WFSISSLRPSGFWPVHTAGNRPTRGLYRRLSVKFIRATVADYLGCGRVVGIKLSLIWRKQVGGWNKHRSTGSTTVATTVLQAIGKIERLRRARESADALIEVLTAIL